MAAKAAVRSKAVVLLLMIRYFVFSPRYDAILCVILVLQSREKAGNFTLIILLMSCDY